MALNEADIFNSAESITVAALQGESTVTALVSSGNIHEKLRDDPTLYSKAEVPAIAVGAYGWRDDGPRKTILQLTVEAVDIGADLATLDSRVKQIMAVVLQFFKKEGATREGNRFNNQVDDVIPRQGSIVQFPRYNNDNEFDGTYFVGSSCQVELTVFS